VRNSAKFAREMAGKLAQRDVVIVSGLAQGIDTSATLEYYAQKEELLEYLALV